LVSASEAESRLAALTSEPELIASDGAAAVGQIHLRRALGGPFWWPANIEPSFPFPFFRVDEFRQAVRSLHGKGECAY
jgi:hypothetical protein